MRFDLGFVGLDQEPDFELVGFNLVFHFILVGADLGLNLLWGLLVLIWDLLVLTWHLI